MDDQVFAEFRAAVDRAEADQGLMEKALRERCGEVDGGKRQAAVCPWCRGKKSLGFYPRDGKIFFHCFKDGCPAKENSGPLTKFLMFDRGLGWIEAGREVLRMANIADPSAEDEAAVPKAREIVKPLDEPAVDETPPAHPPLDPEPVSLASPAETVAAVPPPTVWDDIHGRLSLNHGDREKIKRERGLSGETIAALGFRSGTGNNRALLQPVLSAHPLATLLTEGIAVKDTETGEFKLNVQLCGWGLKKRGSGGEDDEWDWTNPALIPYLDKHGRVTSIRPHKGGLSGKRWMREHG